MCVCVCVERGGVVGGALLGSIAGFGLKSLLRTMAEREQMAVVCSWVSIVLMCL